MPKRVIIIGAAGRDFHNFNVYLRDNPDYDMVAFTAAQIPNIAGRRYPAELAGPRYPDGIPIEPEAGLERLIHEHAVDVAIFGYSDVSHQQVMTVGSRVLAAGADYLMLSPRHTQLAADVPVLAVCAARTGSGKSQTTRRVAALVRELGRKVVIVRHPMPYGDLTKQILQRFAKYDDFEAHNVTIEEREEYEPIVAAHGVVYAGVDYQRILDEAQREADVILWDGGNNDFPFYRPDLLITVVDPHRPDHAERYFPGGVNVRCADVIVINKVDTAGEEQIERALDSVRTLNPTATVVLAASPIHVDEPDRIRGKRVLVIEDGPTLTHGGMAFGAGWLAARRYGAAAIVDPRPWAVGSIAETFAAWPTTGHVLPAMGYGAEQMEELAETIRAADVDLVVVGTPIDLRRVIEFDKPAVRVGYELQTIGEPTLEQVLHRFFVERDSAAYRAIAEDA
jgi:predicted GTPase